MTQAQLSSLIPSLGSDLRLSEPFATLCAMDLGNPT